VWNLLLHWNLLFQVSKIYSYVCELAREITQQMLESYDEELAKSRDKKVYRGKGKRKTSIKTIYGEVEYSRNVYRTETEDGQVAHIFLLDQAMHMDKIGLISTNLAEKIALTVTESPYRVTAEQISSTCGQSISAGGVWNMMQRLGERIDEEKEKQNRSTLVNKTMLAGMEKSNDFHAKREACIRKKYAADEIGQRILNGDGGSWIKEPYDPDTIFQLDRYHIYQEILRKISNKDAQKEIRRLFDEEKMDEMLEYIQIYATSVASQDENDKSSKKAMELYQYLNNKDGLLPYDKRGINIPAPEKGILYKGMGIQETQNCTVITLRMKHRRMRWSVNGANNLAKALYRKENRELVETIDRYTDGLVFTMQMQEIIETLSAAKAPKKDGKGNPYADRFNHHMPLFEAMQTVSRKAFKRAFGY
jgi:hypothetical protein